MNRQSNYKELGQDTIESVVNYFLENAQQGYATAVRNAAGQVIAYLNENYTQLRFNKTVNRNLCEALFFMNSDPNCDYKNLIVTRKLLENYREMNGLPIDDFESEIGPVEIEFGGNVEDAHDPMSEIGFDHFEDECDDELDCDDMSCEWEPDTADEEESVIAAVDIGETLVVSDFISDHFGHVDFRDRLANEDEILDAIKHLVNMGVFEVLDRDEYNGKISVVKRIR